ncbi:hypothetical protein LWM68_29340 [Niabella sp. W65]|nr:hypothetical protein [Niabella sp. W65]MCH7366514.1 hypothetical protein [Niabella sp. W65]
MRELKNIAEQISVLSPEKNINARELSRYLQPYSNNRLPAVVVGGQNQQEFQNERDSTSFSSI